MSLAPGTRIGTYEITALVGAGGMGEVYRARDARLGREIALKLLPEAFASDPDRLMRFEREARTLASLNHPHIAHIYGLEESDGAQALVMELVDGQGLDERIASGGGTREPDPDGWLPLDEALPIARQIAEALEAAHNAGIIHRDLKPANVKVRADGTVKVLDFGLAKALDQEVGDRRQETGQTAPTITSPAMTMRGVILGTAAYMAPEQAKGKPVDKRADIWAFGCVLYEMLTGRRAFDGEDITDTLALVLRGEPDWTRLPSSLPAPLLTLVKRCLERDVKRRIGDMSAVRFVLDDLGALTPAPAVPVADSAQTDARIAIAITETRWRLVLRALTPLAGVAVLAAALGVYGYQRLAPAAAAPVVVRFQLPMPEGQVIALARRMMAVSPNGRELAYVTDSQLFVRRLAEFDAAPLPGLEANQAPTSPTYSPDGAWIAFHSGTERAVKKVSARGGVPLRVCETPPPLTINWDAAGLLLGAGSAGVLRCSSEGGTPETLVKANDGEVMLGPQLLPGGRQMLVTIGHISDVPGVRWDRSRIVVHSLETGERRTLVAAGTDGQLLSTGHLVYRSRGILFAAAFDPARAELRGEPAPVVEGVMRGTLGSSQMAVSGTGSLVYIPGRVSGDSNERELATSDRAGAVTRVPLPAAAFVHVRASRDGRRVVLASDNGKDAIVWVYNLDGQSAPRRLTLDGQSRYPIWSPDGQWIAFQSDRGGDAGIYRQRADGSGGAERLTTSRAGESHVPESWSPDGRHLSYAVRTVSSEGPGYTLQVLTLADMTSAPFGSVTSREPIGSNFSPDGRWLAYTSTPGDDVSAADRGVFVQPFPANGAVFQVPRQLVDFHPMWSADGGELVFLASTNARQMASVRVSAEGGLTFGTPSRFPASVSGDRLSAEPRSFDLLPNGRLIGVVAPSDPGRAVNSELRVVLSWTEELKARVPVK